MRLSGVAHLSDLAFSLKSMIAYSEALLALWQAGPSRPHSREFDLVGIVHTASTTNE